MQQTLPHMSEAFLGHKPGRGPADLGRGLAVRVSSLVPESPAPSDHRARYRTIAAVCLALIQLMVREIHLAALIWALILMQASIAGSLAAGEVSPSNSDGSEAAPTAVQVATDSPMPVAHWEPGSHRRAYRRVPARPESARLYAPNGDDGTSRDPDDDDDTSNDLNSYDNSDAPIQFSPHGMVLYLIAPEAETAPAGSEIPSSPFPTLQPLRC